MSNYYYGKSGKGLKLIDKKIEEIKDWRNKAYLDHFPAHTMAEPYWNCECIPSNKLSWGQKTRQVLSTLFLEIWKISEFNVPPKQQPYHWHWIVPNFRTKCFYMSSDLTGVDNYQIYKSVQKLSTLCMSWFSCICMNVAWPLYIDCLINFYYMHMMYIHFICTESGRKCWKILTYYVSLWPCVVLGTWVKRICFNFPITIEGENCDNLISTRNLYYYVKKIGNQML